MNHKPYDLRRTALAVATAMALAGTAQAAPQFRFAQKPVDGQYIVVLRDDVAALANERRPLPGVAQVATQLAAQHGARVQRTFSHALRGFVVRADANALARMLRDQRIAYIEQDGHVRTFSTQANATWGLDRSDQRSLPLNGTYTFNTTASNVNTYIIDTGVLGSHQEFSGRMIAGFTAINDGNGTSDCNGHGTHVAGTVAGTTFGIAKAARISPIRVLNCQGSGTNSGVIAGMDWVVANHVKPAVANMSLGGGASTATDDAVARMTNAGVIVVVAGGNDNADACNFSPARAPSAITVGSTTNTDARSSFSNWGSCLDIFAPGSSITSAWHSNNTATNTISGTSMAAPHVAGGAALFLANNPGATVAQVTQAVLDNATLNTVTSPGSNSPNRLLFTLFGSGGGDTTPPSQVTGLTASAASSSQINLSWSAASDTGGSGLAGYRVERCAGSGCTNFAEVATTTTTSHSDTGLAASTSYSYRVRAFDGAGNNGTYSSTASATTAAASGSTLSRGVTLTGLAASTGNALNYTMTVPSGAQDLRFVMSGGTGDADLYVRFGSAPTATTFDCRPYLSGNSETCSFASPQAGTWHVMVHAFSSFSGVSLVGDWAQTYSNGTDFAIHDHSTVESPIAVSGRAGNGWSGSRVAVDIRHTFIGDLLVQLVAPDGSLYTLHNRTGTSTDNIIRSYTVNLSSEPMNGTWRLRVNDNATADTGFINSWSITF